MFLSHIDEEKLVEVAQAMADCLSPPLLIALQGNLGAGKTTFVRALLRGLGVTGAIKSPTYSLVETYRPTHENWQLHHFDLYRIEDEHELEYIGFRDYFTQSSICLIEWPDKSEFCQTSADLVCSLYIKKCHRDLRIVAQTSKGEGILSCLSKK